MTVTTNKHQILAADAAQSCAEHALPVARQSRSMGHQAGRAADQSVGKGVRRLNTGFGNASEDCEGDSGRGKDRGEETDGNGKTGADPKAQREWLLAHLVDDLEAQGKLDAQKYRNIETMLKNATDGQVGAAVQYYQQRKAQVEAEQLAQAQANLSRLQAYRDRLKLEVARRSQVYQQEQAMMAYGSALAQQQGQWAMGNFYAAQAWPYYYVPQPWFRHQSGRIGRATTAKPIRWRVSAWNPSQGASAGVKTVARTTNLRQIVAVGLKAGDVGQRKTGGHGSAHCRGRNAPSHRRLDECRPGRGLGRQPCRAGYRQNTPRSRRLTPLWPKGWLVA